ncbi:hypothetical protein ZWY2020_038711, partial [Hordeum vulgare]
TIGVGFCYLSGPIAGAGDAMLVMRDALLWQLQKDRLRQEIIMAELAKIECAMALRSVSGHHSTPMPRDSMPPHRGPVFGWENYADVGEENDVKLPNNCGRKKDRAEKMLNSCKCRVNSGEHNPAFDEPKLQDPSEEKWELTGTTIPVKKPKPPMSPRKERSHPEMELPMCQVEANSAQKHCAGKKHQSNIATLESSIKAIGYQKPPLAGCSICQVMCGTESDLEIHLKGKRHLKKIQALFEESNNKEINSESLKANLNKDSRPLHVEKMNRDLDSENHLRDERHQLNVRTLCETINQEGNSPPEISKDQTPSSEWDYAMCQVKCISKAHFENHCTSRKHQQRTQEAKLHESNVPGHAEKPSSVQSCNICQAPCKEGNNSNTYIAPREAKSDESNVSQHAEKPPSVWCCSDCQVICGRKPDLEVHLKCERHLKKIGALLKESKNMAISEATESKPVHGQHAAACGENELWIELRTTSEMRDTN